MSKKDLAPSDASEETQEITEGTNEEASAVEESEETLADTLGGDSTKEEVKEESKETTVSLAKHIKTKKALKEAKRQLKELSEAEDGDDSEDEPDEDDNVKESSNDPRVDALLREREQEKLNTKFDALYEKTIAANPEYSGVADKEIIKQLAFSKSNASKTLSAVLEQTYGNLVTGRSSADTSIKPAKPAPGSIDFARAAKDSEYYSELMADPELKAKYNADMESRLNM